MELSRGDFSQFSMEGRDRLLAIHGKLVASKIYAQKTYMIYRFCGFYVSKTIRNDTGATDEIEIIMDAIAEALLPDE